MDRWVYLNDLAEKIEAQKIHKFHDHKESCPEHALIYESGEYPNFPPDIRRFHIIY